jgi:hypothetical protein
VTTDSRHSLPVYPNLARGMTPTAINQLWVADITGSEGSGAHEAMRGYPGAKPGKVEKAVINENRLPTRACPPSL